jgi:hypothetical protein
MCVDARGFDMAGSGGEDKRKFKVPIPGKHLVLDGPVLGGGAPYSDPDKNFSTENEV